MFYNIFYLTRDSQPFVITVNVYMTINILEAVGEKWYAIEETTICTVITFLIIYSKKSIFHLEGTQFQFTLKLFFL